MDNRNMLRTGDPCPCCGQPIKTIDPEVLRLLTYIRDSRAVHNAGHEFMEGRKMTPHQSASG